MLALGYLQENLLLDSIICKIWEFLGYLQQGSRWNEMLCVARVMDAQNLLLAVLGRPQLLLVVVGSEKWRKSRECRHLRWNRGKTWQQLHVFDVLSAHMEKETDCLTNAKGTRGICAFLGKVLLGCDWNKDSVFNLQSPKRQIGLAWIKCLVPSDPEVSRTRVALCQGCQVSHRAYSACFILKSHLGF